MANAPSFLMLWLRDGSVCRVQLHHLQEVDTALGRSVDVLQGEPDTMLRLTGLAGERIAVLASALLGFNVSTPAKRAHDRDLDAALEREGKAPEPTREGSTI